MKEEDKKFLEFLAEEYGRPLSEIQLQYEKAVSIVEKKSPKAPEERKRIRVFNILRAYCESRKRSTSKLVKFLYFGSDDPRDIFQQRVKNVLKEYREGNPAKKRQMIKNGKIKGKKEVVDGEVQYVPVLDEDGTPIVLDDRETINNRKNRNYGRPLRPLYTLRLFGAYKPIDDEDAEYTPIVVSCWRNIADPSSTEFILNKMKEFAIHTVSLNFKSTDGHVHTANLDGTVTPTIEREVAEVDFEEIYGSESMQPVLTTLDYIEVDGIEMKGINHYHETYQQPENKRENTNFDFFCIVNGIVRGYFPPTDRARPMIILIGANHRSDDEGTRVWIKEPMNLGIGSEVIVVGRTTRGEIWDAEKRERIAGTLGDAQINAYGVYVVFNTGDDVELEIDEKDIEDFLDEL